jgi:adenosylhomocysteinase
MHRWRCLWYGPILAGRQATVFGAGWVGSGVMGALKRLDMIPTVVDTDPVKVVEARLNGFLAISDGGISILSPN